MSSSTAPDLDRLTHLHCAWAEFKAQYYMVLATQAQPLLAYADFRDSCTRIFRREPYEFDWNVADNPSVLINGVLLLT